MLSLLWFSVGAIGALLVIWLIDWMRATAETERIAELNERGLTNLARHKREAEERQKRGREQAKAAKLP